MRHSPPASHTRARDNARAHSNNDNATQQDETSERVEENQVNNSDNEEGHRAMEAMSHSNNEDMLARMQVLLKEIESLKAAMAFSQRETRKP